MRAPHQLPRLADGACGRALEEDGPLHGCWLSCPHARRRQSPGRRLRGGGGSQRTRVWPLAVAGVPDDGADDGPPPRVLCRLAALLRLRGRGVRSLQMLLGLPLEVHARRRERHPQRLVLLLGRPRLLDQLLSPCLGRDGWDRPPRLRGLLQQELSDELGCVLLLALPLLLLLGQELVHLWHGRRCRQLHDRGLRLRRHRRRLWCWRLRRSQELIHLRQRRRRRQLHNHRLRRHRRL
mmetsp:Transcript_49093/g.152356  ORF Transcript_49093/g.152356 Transcript_49093/m.152356 type:complete len:237 (-) Transcript_49093:94-804(-)